MRERTGPPRVVMGLKCGWRRSKALQRLGVPILGIIVAIASLPACQGSTSSSSKPVLTIAEPDGPTSVDPTNFGYADIITSTAFAYEGLLHRNYDGTYAPALATSWKFVGTPGTADAYKEVDFTLRAGARYSDGTPVTAESIKAWFDYGMKTSPNFAGYLSPSSYEVTGPLSMAVHLTASNPNAFYGLTDRNPGYGTPVSPKCLADPSVLKTTTCGAGRYTLDPSATVPNDHYTFLPNPYYYDKSKQFWSKVILKIIPTPSTMLQALETGQIDVAYGDPSTAPAAAAAGYAVYHANAYNAGWFLDAEGAKVPALADVRVRQALNYAIDRKALAAALVGNYGTATDEVHTYDGVDPAFLNYYPYDPALAKSLLAQAGYAKGFSIDVGVYGRYGVVGTPQAQAVAKYLGDVGVTLNLHVFATLSAWGASLADPLPMYQGIFGVDFMTVYYPLFMQPGTQGLNFLKGGWDDAVLDGLYNDGLTAADPASYFRRVTDRAVTEAWFLPTIVVDTDLFANKKKVKGILISAAMHESNLPDWMPA
jgi:peptide/nickel transport system substrate-binding protein